ncbi:MAG: 4-hydroxy-tetrahydrodipicolinate synthase [Gammaproteobacteria bacterium]|nr:4-hydroxy-tetrahydrodipicolinate synthase [Gammaproteobacteria bacterium]
MSKEIRGSIVAIVTPMHDDGSLDLPALNKLLEWHIESGTHGVVIVGTTGESATLSTEEHCDLVGHCVDQVKGRGPVIAGTGSNNTQEALYFTESARQNGADAALLVAPYYNRPSQEGLYQHFKVLAKGVDIPQILYNVPGRTACDLSLETVDRLADLENVVAIKDATGDIPRGIELVRKCGDRLAVYSGEDAITLPLMMAGALGTISVTANVAPMMMSQMCSLALAGEEAAAQAIDDKLMSLHQNLFLEGNPVPVKWAMAQMGLIGSGIRLPLVELDSKFQLQVSEALTAAGIVLSDVA